MRTMEALACVEPGRFEHAKRPRPEGRPGNIRVRIAVLGEHTDGGMCARSWRPTGNLYSAHGLTPQAAPMIDLLVIGAHLLRSG